MDDEILINLFCPSLDSRLGLLLRSMKVLLEYGLSGHASGDCGWLRNGSDGAVLLLRLLLRVGYVEKGGNHRCVAALATISTKQYYASIPAYIEQSMKLFVCLSRGIGCNHVTHTARCVKVPDILCCINRSDSDHELSDA